MRKEKFVYNEQTLRYERHVAPVRVRALRTAGQFLLVLACSAGLTYLAYNVFPSHREEALAHDLALVERRFAELNDEVEVMSTVLENVQERDAAAHRLVFGMDPIDRGVWDGGTGGHDRREAPGSTAELIEDARARTERLKRRLVLQSRSLDTILDLAREKELMLASVPSIKPIRKDKLARDIRYLSGYGMRIHPIYKRRRMHKGLDFSAPRGTPIQAPGDAVVKAVKKHRTGYGHHVILDHGYGYETLYGHMSDIHVKRGQKVKRGEVIGLVGSTGASTGPHLHYEVHIKGQHVDPIHYCIDGLSAEEYQAMVDDAAAAGQSFD